MELNELFKAFDKSVAQDAYCQGNKTASQGWKARINQWGTLGDCSGKQLYASMGKDKTSGYLGPPKSYVEKPSKAGYKWNFGSVDRDHFPIQAHHLIPKNYLPDHPVCTFLAAKYTKHKKYQLTADTNYDTDRSNNGYCLPYATPLDEWKAAGGDDSLKAAIAFEVMDRTKRQLHQGSHRARPYEEDPADPDEEAKIHPVGYLNAVKKYLNLVQDGAQNHVDTCLVCKPSKAKKEVQPLEAVANHVDQVSGIVKLLIDANRIFVSELASMWWGDKQRRIDRPKWL